MSNDVLLITRALDFATRAHTDQRRKGAREEPYINHLADVAWMLAQATSGKDATLIAAGLLHDTIEDQGVTHAILADLFGIDVANLVAEVTDDKLLLKQERKRLQIEHAPHKSPRARMLKIADKTSNLRAILHSPPTDWTRERKLEYFAWADRVIAGCRGINPWLDAQFDGALTAGKTHL